MEHTTKTKGSLPVDAGEIDRLIGSALGGRIVGVEQMGAGYGGHVFKLVCEDGPADVVVAKFVSADKEQPFESEDATSRIYGTRWSNFQPSHQLFIKHNIPVPQLLHEGTTEDGRFRYAFMEYLPGVSVREFLSTGGHKEMTVLHAAVGEWFGNIHRITRQYYGWIDMKKPHITSFGDTLFSSIEDHLREIEKNRSLTPELQQQVKVLLSRRSGQWREPTQLVFSHTDGFQGITSHSNAGWNLEGIIDIEDHQFTDQCMVLAGHELSSEMEGRVLPAVFWKAYEKQTKIDARYEETKDLFKLFYLLVWRCVFHDWWHGGPKNRERLIHKVEKLIKEIVSK